MGRGEGGGGVASPQNHKGPQSGGKQRLRGKRKDALPLPLTKKEVPSAKKTWEWPLETGKEMFFPEGGAARDTLSLGEGGPCQASGLIQPPFPCPRTLGSAGWAPGAPGLRAREPLPGCPLQPGPRRRHSHCLSVAVVQRDSRSPERCECRNELSMLGKKCLTLFAFCLSCRGTDFITRPTKAPGTRGRIGFGQLTRVGVYRGGAGHSGAFCLSPRLQHTPCIFCAQGPGLL